VFRDRIGQLQLAVLDQHHGGDRDQRLGHRIDAEHRIEPHLLAFGLVLEADRVGIDELALAGDHHHGARQHALVDLGLQRLAHALEALRRHADLLGARLRERKLGVGVRDVCSGDWRSENERADQHGAQHRSCHD
jgi:hypothetical protein